MSFVDEILQPGEPVRDPSCRHIVESNTQKVKSVSVEQTLLGRLFNYSDVTLRGVGSALECLRFIDPPLRLRTTVTAS